MSLSFVTSLAEERGDEEQPPLDEQGQRLVEELHALLSALRSWFTMRYYIYTVHTYTYYYIHVYLILYTFIYILYQMLPV